MFAVLAFHEQRYVDLWKTLDPAPKVDERSTATPPSGNRGSDRTITQPPLERARRHHGVLGADTGIGARTSVTVLFPSCPTTFLPQQYTWAVVVRMPHV
jgi:hypothetical protein